MTKVLFTGIRLCRCGSTITSLFILRASVIQMLFNFFAHSRNLGSRMVCKMAGSSFQSGNVVFSNSSCVAKFSRTYVYTWLRLGVPLVVFIKALKLIKQNRIKSTFTVPARRTLSPESLFGRDVIENCVYAGKTTEYYLLISRDIFMCGKSKRGNICKKFVCERELRLSSSFLLCLCPADFHSTSR